jgi:uncharacterized membrane protein
MSRSRILVGALILSLGASMLVHAQPQPKPEFFDIPGADGTTAWAINPSGDVVGTAVSQGSSVFHGYQRSRSGTATAVDVTTAGTVAKDCTSARGISPSGEIVGFFQTLTCDGTKSEMRTGAHGFVRARNGTTEVVDVKLAGTLGTVVFGINPAGELVGAYLDAANRIHGFLRKGGTITTIDVPGAASTTCRGINANGEIVGRVDTHGYLRKAAGTVETIDFPGATRTVVAAVNPRGDVVGIFVKDDVTHGFVRKAGGQPVELDVVPGATETQPTGISPSGEIVGWVTFKAAGVTKTRGFIQR